MANVNTGTAAARFSRPATTAAVSEANQSTIIEALRTYGPISKARLVALTGLSTATVNRQVTALMSSGFVSAVGVEASSGGRPPVLLAVVGSALVVGAIQLHSDAVSGALVDFNGAIVERIDMPIPQSGRQGLAIAHDVDATLRRLADARGTSIRSTGISLPAIVEPSRAIPGLDSARWPDLTIHDLQWSRETPVIVENDANVLAIAELHHGVGREYRNFVTIVLDRGLGAGIVIEGAPYRGARASAGEVGHLLVGETAFSQRFTDVGDLETRITTDAVSEALRDAGVASPTNVSAMEAIALARSGVEAASSIAEGVLDQVARATAALCSILDPECVVFGDGFSSDWDYIQPALARRLDGRILHVPRMTTATQGSDAILLGAAELAIRSVGQTTDSPLSGW